MTTEEKVRQQTMREVNPTAHWLYLSSVMLGGLILMIVLMALLSGGR